MNKQKYIERLIDIADGAYEYNLRNEVTKAVVYSGFDLKGMPTVNVAIHAVNPENKYHSEACSAYFLDSCHSDRINEILEIKEAATRSNE